MGVNLSINKRFLAGKAESSPGTYNTPLDADFNVRCYDIDLAPSIEMDNENAKYANGTHSECESIAGAQSVTLKFKCRASWGGAVATPPDWWKFATGCGCDTVSYTTVGRGLVGRSKNDDATMSFVVIDQEIGESSPVYTQYKIAGAIGNMRISAEKVGAPWVAEFEFKGKLVDVVDGTTLTLTSPQSTLAETFLSSTCVVNGGSPKISKFSFDMGNTISPLYDQSDATGYSHFIITERHPRYTIDPLAVKQATVDWLNNVMTANVSTLTISSTNFKLKGIQAQPMPPSLGTREGLVSLETTYRLLVNGTPGSLTDTGLTYEDTWELLQGART